MLELNPKELKILMAIYRGFNIMSEIVDYVSETEDSRSTNLIIEKLDEQGFIVRGSLRGAGFYIFHLLPKGREFLAKSGESKQVQFVKNDLTKEDLDTLNLLKKHSSIVSSRLIDYVKDDRNELMARISKLARLGYITEGGLFRRELSISKKAQELGLNI